MTASDGVRLSVNVTGEKTAPTVVLVHGYPDNSAMWSGVADRLTGYRVVRYDVRGAGASEAPPSRSGYRLDQLADDLAAVADAVSPHRPFHVLAHDWGSIQAWHAVTGDRLRGRISSFTSISGPDLDHVGHWFRQQLRRPTPRRLRNAFAQLAHSAYIAFFQLPVIPESSWRLGVMPLLIRRLDPSAGKQDKRDGINGLELYRANMFTRIGKPAERGTDVPVQVLVPKGDRFVTGPLQAEVARWATNLRVRRISGTHWVPRSDPGLIASATAEFVDHVEGGAETRALRRARVNPAPGGRFPGNLVVVTGAGSGIGRATALAFAEQGADLVLADVDSGGNAETARLVRATGRSAAEYTVDVGKGEQVSGFADTVRAEHGVPDIVVNNAGIGMAGPFLETGAGDWERVIDVNLWGVINGCRAFAPLLAERGEGGHIVNIASIAAYLPNKVLPAYSTTKAAVLALSACLRAELAGKDIGVSAICPGIVRTSITETTTFVGTAPDEQRRRRKQGTRMYAMRGFGPERVAEDILRAVERNTALAPSTPEAKTALVLSRLTPGLLRAAAAR
ncbi:short chain dehydrogenase [Prauserella marina]|uniref:Short-chain dehydrogenase n=1 Tax=Prauserella marina TaxID=530584 RepID=A0A222W0J5_9PSEU|nr:SDR family oxidoreductase [Prauserella marina]ASR39724.1 short chain dehydrogenase [Prauserella marina]PWV78640.1 short-subunit dehydrogenase [Prauserella marina]SDC90554.1 Short-chain dehydrogenase [Prauserella marina]